MGASASAIPLDQQEAFRNSAPTFLVSLFLWKDKTVELPSVFKLKISFESLDFIGNDDTPIIQFPFQTIICWGSSPQNFQFKVFNFEENAVGNGKGDNSILISLKTSEGRIIEDVIMGTVQNLMKDMDGKVAINKEEFSTLVKCIFEEGGQDLKDNWLVLIDQFTCTGRYFLAKQGMELLTLVKPYAPFEKFDLACLLYNRIINKESYQLLVNCFEDEQERDNLIHRLRISSSGVNLAATKELSSKCKILPEKAIKQWEP
jgi:hypothetical protein